MTVDEIHIFGVFAPAGLLWALLAGPLAWLLSKPLARLPLLGWRPQLLELALFLLFWWGFATGVDLHLVGGA